MKNFYKIARCPRRRITDWNPIFQKIVLHQWGVSKAIKEKIHMAFS